MATENYTYNGTLARKVDLYIMGTPTLESGKDLLAPLTFQSATGGRVSAGIAKLMQRVVITLLSSNILYETGWGNSFSKYAIAGTANEVTKILYRAVDKTAQLLAEPITDEKPMDEQLAQLSVVSVDVSRGSISIVLNVATNAGVAVDLVLPLKREPFG